MSKNIRQLAEEALMLQDACNLAGVAGALQRTVAEIARMPGESTSSAAMHPVTRVIIDKIMDLAGMDERVRSGTWDHVHRLSEGTNIDRLREAVEEGK